MSSDQKQIQPPAISRTELLWLAGAVIFGAVLRLSFPGRMAIEHFDEGVYASNFWFDADEGYAYPARYLYAPPLLPAAIEWTMVIASLIGIKPAGFIPMIPCLVAGVVTIPSMWWIGRRWFGPTAGLISAWLVATSDFHVCYSRAAMTDVPVCLFILWAVYFVERAFSKITLSGTSIPSNKKTKSLARTHPLPWRDMILAATFTGLAWWTKYNGWLPLAIGLAGGFLWQLLTPKPERQIRCVLECWCLIALLAGLIWSPVLWGLQKHGGYASVAANHRQYLVGIEGWGDSALRQAEHVGIYDNWLGMFTEPFGVSEAETARFDRQWPLFDIVSQIRSADQLGYWGQPLIRKLALLANRIANFFLPVMILIVAGIALRWQIRFSRPGPQRIAVCLLAAWCCGMTVTTPFYYPYPRLIFPWLMAIWFALGLAVHVWRSRLAVAVEIDQPAAMKLWRPSRLERVIVVWLLVNCLVRSMAGSAHAWQDRTSLAGLSNSIARNIERQVGARGSVNEKAVVYVWGEPAVVFGLRANGVQYARPVADLGFLGSRSPIPTFTVFGEQTYRGQNSSAEFRKLERCQLSELFRIHPSHLVVMDSKDREFFYRNDSDAPRIWFYRAPE